ncbi:HAD-like protein [Hypoxylon sp. NC1633]|nr:HAD-like protein [Hypoxylon sp. NC1633]
MSQAQTSPETRSGLKAARIKAVFFDFMGTCLDWHGAVVKGLPATIPEAARSRLALDWREEFFKEIHSRSQQGLPHEDIDTTHRRTLLRILGWKLYREERQHFAGLDGSTSDHADGGTAAVPSIEQAIQSWLKMEAWPDVLPGLIELKKKFVEMELFVLANGTTRLQLDLARSSGLGEIFSRLFSSERLGVYKPAPEAYEKALGLVGVKPVEAVMVAAHAYDLRAARKVGMHTLYIYRWTDDRSEDQVLIREKQSDMYLRDNGMQELARAIEGLDTSRGP